MKYFQIKNATAESADLYLYGDIVGAEWEKWSDLDTCPQDIIDALKEHEGKNLKVYVNSGGGAVFAGMAIYNQLKRFSGKKTAIIDGLAGSISSVIPFACDEILIPSNAYMMIHRAWTVAMGNANDFREMANTMDRIDEGIVNVYSENLKDGVDVERVKALMDAETWLTGEQAAEVFNVTLLTETKAAACTSDYFDRYANTPAALKAKADPELTPEPDGNLSNEIDILKMKLQLV